MINRIILQQLPKDHFFLFGPRQVGKTTALQRLNSVFYVDLLNREQQLDYTKDPQKLYRQINALNQQKGRIIIDEVQKVPSLLDVIQQIMDQFPYFQWVLSGSSARKLKRESSNLLGGRVLKRVLHPLTFEEANLDLSQVLAFGSLPHVYLKLKKSEKETARDLLKSYITTYLFEEIKIEALARNLQGFQNFLEVAAFQFTEPVNFSRLAEEARLSYTTVREYYSILEDTWIGFFIPPFLPSTRKRLQKSPKFYFFDNGVTRAISGTLRSDMGKIEKGQFFEQWIIQEIKRLNDYYQKDWKLRFWRTSHGAEVDLLITLGKKVVCAVEFKYKQTITSADLSGLNAFKKDFPRTPCYIGAPVPYREKRQQIMILPPFELLHLLKEQY